MERISSDDLMIESRRKVDRTYMMLFIVSAGGRSVFFLLLDCSFRRQRNALPAKLTSTRREAENERKKEKQQRELIAQR